MSGPSGRCSPGRSRSFVVPRRNHVILDALCRPGRPPHRDRSPAPGGADPWRMRIGRGGTRRSYRGAGSSADRRWRPGCSAPARPAGRRRTGAGARRHRTRPAPARPALGRGDRRGGPGRPREPVPRAVVPLRRDRLAEPPSRSSTVRGSATPPRGRRPSCCSIDATGRAHRGVVDLRAAVVRSYEPLPAGLQPPIMVDEFAECEEAVKRSPEFLARC